MANRENPPSEKFTPPDPTNYASRSDIADRARKVVQEAHQLAVDARANIEHRWARYYAAWRGKRVKKAYHSVRANVVDPEPGKAIETLHSRLADIIMGQRPLARGIPREPADDKQVTLNEQLIQFQMDADNVEQKLDSGLKNLCIFGTAIFRVNWREEFRQSTKRVKAKDDQGWDLVAGEVPVYRGPSMREIPIDDFYIGNIRAEDIEDQDFVIERRIVDYAWLQSLQKKDFITNVDKIRRSAEPSTISAMDPERYLKQQQAEAAGLSWLNLEGNAFKGSEKVELFIYEGKFALNGPNEVHKPFQPEVNCWIWMAADGTILRCQENPYWHGKKSYVSSHFIKVPGEFYGIGVIDWIEDLWAELCDTHNQILDAKSLHITPSFLAGAGAGVTSNKLLLSPGRVNRINGDVNQMKPLVIPDTSAAGYNSVGTIRTMMRETTGATDIMHGQTAGGIDKATIFAGLLAESNVRVKKAARTFFHMCIEPMMNRWYALNQQFIDQEIVIRVIGQDGFDWLPVRPDDLNVPMDFKGTGTGAMGTVLARNAGIQSFFQMMLPLAQAGLPVDLLELAKRMWHDVFGYNDGDRIFGDKNALRAHDAREENMMLSQRQAVDVHPNDDDIAHMQSHLEIATGTEDPMVMKLALEHIQDHQEAAQEKEAQRQMQAAAQEAQMMGQMRQAMEPGGPTQGTSAAQAAPVPAAAEGQMGGLTANQERYGADMGAAKDAGEKLAGRQG